MKSSPTRQALLEAACELFYQHGIHATSVDAVLEKAGVARQSLYQHFSSKDGLAAEFLKLRDARWRLALQQHIARVEDPYGKLTAIFDFLEQWFAAPNFHGCAFINTAVEYPDPHPFHLLAAEHKTLVRKEIADICRKAGLENAEALSHHLALLMEGAIVTEQMTPGSGAARHAKEIAILLIQHMTKETTCAA